jgi:hypothetical protein
VRGTGNLFVANRRIAIAIVALGVGFAAAGHIMAGEPAISTYGQINPAAPTQLSTFSFLVGKWQGSGRARQADGTYAHFDGVTWIGRYVLDGMAIADEFHAATPDGKPYLGISLRQFDTRQHAWIIEYLNVSNSFLRRQVNAHSGSVSQDAGVVTVISADGQTRIRESYRVTDKDHFRYSTDTSSDAGRSWGPVSIEIALTKVE